MKIEVIIFILSFAMLSSSQPVSKRSKVRLCGSQLVNTLTMLCGGEFYGPSSAEKIKREADQDFVDYYPSWLLGDQPTRTENPDYTKPRSIRRQIEGIVDECCKKSCSLSVLASYCMK